MRRATTDHGGRAVRSQPKLAIMALGLLTAGLSAPSGAVTIAELFPSPPLAPLTMTAVDGTHVFKTEHRGIFKGRQIRYDATVEEAIVEDPGAVPAADLYTISYVAQGTGDGAGRPVLFIFNGGPGGSSVFLHFCSMGPKILRGGCSPASEANPGTPLVDNPESPLSVADLVFVDPTDTGWSRTLPGVSPEQFHSVNGDSEEVAALIAWWLRRHDRLSSPVYVYGESYGSMRAVAVVRDLARETPKIEASGVMLGGFCITFGPGSGTPDPAWEAMRLPTVASLAWHYGKIDNRHQTWMQAVDRAMVFARTQYVGALMLGHRLDAATRERIIEQLPTYTGIPASYFRSQHSIQLDNYSDVLLRDRGLVLDWDNGMWTLPAGKRPARSPSDFYTTTMERYGATQLGVHGLGPYEIMTPNIGILARTWNYRTGGAPSLEVTLSEELKDNPKLRLLVAQGRYDTTTEVADTLYVLDQTDIPSGRLTMAYFDGGHMLEPTPEAMSAIRSFITRPAGAAK